MIHNTTVIDEGAVIYVAATLPSGRRVQVDVYAPRNSYGGELQPSEVNWPGIGSVNAADAEAFAQLLTRAAAEAGRMDAEHGLL